MTRREAVGLCLSFPDAYEDYPFDDPNWTCMRHRGNRKIFALLFEREGALLLNLKCEPMQAEFWRKVYPQVTPGYHMNKTHWNTVAPDGGLPGEALREMIAHSHALTMPKRGRRP